MTENKIHKAHHGVHELKRKKHDKDRYIIIIKTN